jgi:hypothetical protein
MSSSSRSVAAVVALLVCVVTGAARAEAPSEDTVAARVFDADLLAGVEAPAVLLYTYEMSGSVMPEPFVESIEMRVTDSGVDGKRQVEFEMLAGSRVRRLGPIGARINNPVLLVFLQRDAMQMQRMTGGSQHYFHNRLRKAFTEPSEVESAMITAAGAEVASTRVTIEPFVDDPEIARFPEFRNKRYEFVVSDAVPGGIVRIGSAVPGEDGGSPVFAESISFVGTAESKDASP